MSKTKKHFNIYEYWEENKHSFRELYINCPEKKLGKMNVLINQIHTIDNINYRCIPITDDGATAILAQDIIKNIDLINNNHPEANMTSDKVERYARTLLENMLVRLPASPQSIKLDPTMYTETKDTFATIQPVAEPSKHKVNYAYKYIEPVVPENNINKLDSAGQPVLKSWKEALDRMSDPIAFAAWVWSIYQPDCRDRKMLYLHGEGLCGKSTLVNKIMKNFGDDFCSGATAHDFANATAFGLEDFIGKRLIVLSDLNDNINLPGYSNVRQLTGNDPMKINRKFLGSLMIRLNSRLLVVANNDPVISNNKESITRVLYVHMKSPATKNNSLEWEKGLDDGYSEFLKYCKYSYNERYKNLIIQSESSYDYINKLLGIKSSEDLDTFDQLFEVTNNEEDYVAVDIFWRLMEALNNHAKISNKQKSALKKAAYDYYNLEDFNGAGRFKKKISPDSEERIYVFRGLRFKNEMWAAVDGYNGKINLFIKSGLEQSEQMPVNKGEVIPFFKQGKEG
jgi:hypothetical protein